MWKKLFLLIINSMKLPNSDKISSTRLIAYIIIGIISIYLISLLGIEITVAIISLIKTGTYVISSQIITILFFMMGEVLTLLGVNKRFETKQEVSKNQNQLGNLPNIQTDIPKVDSVINKVEDKIEENINQPG